MDHDEEKRRKIVTVKYRARIICIFRPYFGYCPFWKRGIWCEEIFYNGFQTVKSFSQLWKLIFSLRKIHATPEINFTIFINRKDALYAICKNKIVFSFVYTYILYIFTLYVHIEFLYYMYILYTCKWEINLTFIWRIL